jgi:hypothetical protein
MSLIVTAPAVQLKVEDGRYVHLYKGDSVPAEADKDQLDHLKALKMVAPEPKGKPAGNASKSGQAEKPAES